MHPLVPLLGILALVAVATAIGLLLRARKGRVRKLADTERLEPEIFGVEQFGQAGTIVQFSTEFCSRCPGVRRLLTRRIADANDFEFVHVDLTHNPELAARFGVLQTPTILFIDADGHPRTRLSGQLDHRTIRETVDTFVDGAATNAAARDIATRPQITTVGAIA